MPSPHMRREQKLKSLQVHYFLCFILELQVNSITHQISLAAGLGILVYAGMANWETWKEFYQYFRESKFVSVVNYSCTYVIDFSPIVHYTPERKAKIIWPFGNSTQTHIDNELQPLFV